MPSAACSSPGSSDPAREIGPDGAQLRAPSHKLLLKLGHWTVLRRHGRQTAQLVSRKGCGAAWTGVIDGAVNGVATIVDTGSIVLRRLQTGSVRAYAGSLFIGVVLMLGYYLWR
jgi:hypothetical protein